MSTFCSCYSCTNSWRLMAAIFCPPDYFSHNLFGQSIQTSMQNLESVAQEMSELCSILPFGGHFIFCWHEARSSICRFITGTEQNTKLSITHSFLELQSPDFAWKFVCQNVKMSKMSKMNKMTLSSAS